MPYSDEKPSWSERFLGACFRSLDTVGRFGRKLVWPIEFGIAKLVRSFFRLLDKASNLTTRDQADDDENAPVKSERLAYAAFQSLDGIASIGRAVVRPIENLFGRIIYTFFRAVTVTETRDSKASKFLYALGAPIRWLVFSVQWIFGRLNLDPIVKPIVFVFARIGYWLSLPFLIALGFIAVFCRTRSRKLLWYAIPMLLLGGGLGFVIFSVRTQEKPTITARYRKALEAAIDQQDFATAGLYQEKLKQLGSSVDQFDLKSADSLLKKGEVDKAFELVGRLAPTDQLGLPAAHLWLAVHLLGQAPFDQTKLSIPVQKRCEVALQHLDLLEQAKFSSIELSILRSLALSILGKVDDAKQTLASHRDQHLPTALMRFQLNLQSADGNSAKEDASAVSRLMSRDLESQAKADAQTMQLWFLAEMMLQKTSEAESVALKWSQNFPEDTGARNALLALRLARFDRRLNAASTADYPELSKLFLETYRLSNKTTQEPFKQRIYGLFVAAQKGDRKAKEMFRLLQAEELDASLSEMFGTSAASVKSYDAARKYLEKAVELDPSFQVAWNNLAFVLEQGFPDAIESALMAANKAVELNDQDVHALDTRASILIRLNRYDEAKRDVDAILKIDPKFENAKNLQEKIETSIARGS